MASAVRIARCSIDGDGVVYEWVRDDRSTGHVVVDEAEETIRPCDAMGNVIGQMLIRRTVGDVENPEPESRGNFVVVAAAIFREWVKAGSLPEAVSRSFG
ncbi:hypothetical protein AB0K89_15915 [Streptomyces cinnamoneus]|uniref:hypothetical protein n=1 Tax=Streptomyces cinnamoneus TaxID=53446 RepID=UPI00343D2FFF